MIELLTYTDKVVFLNPFNIVLMTHVVNSSGVTITRIETTGGNGIDVRDSMQDILLSINGFLGQ